MIDFEDFGDLKTKLRAEFDKDIANGQNKVPVNEEYRRLIKLYEAVIDGSAELIDKDYLDSYLSITIRAKGHLIPTVTIGRWMTGKSLR